MAQVTEPWTSFSREDAFSPVEGKLWRFVESQEQIATLNLVSTLDEQVLLEDLLESIKPPRPVGTERLDYLLATPFRYPPLPWGSRFGRTWEPGIFYGSCNLHTAQAETAYYRLMFWRGMSQPPASGALTTQHHAFSATYACQLGARLQSPPWSTFEESLTHATDYSSSQAVGSWLRQHELEGFEFQSARCPQKGINVALFKPQGLCAEKPKEMQQWLCQTTSNSVTFSRSSGALKRFNISEIPLF